MLTEFISIKADDGAVHQGLLFKPSRDTEKGAVHVHGLAGNFYENSFIPVMAEKYAERGIAFLSCNNRGHDYMADIEKDDKSGSAFFKGGGAYERFGECPRDIDAAVRFFEKNGISRIFLQGHSTGCNKIVYSASQKKFDSVYCAALLSPCDDIALMTAEEDIKFEEGLRLAQKLVNEGKGGTLLPPETVFYPMSARTYLDYYTAGSAHDIFRYREPRSDFPGLSGLELPVLSTYGTEGEYLTISAEEAFGILKTKVRSPEILKTKTIAGAGHNYKGFEGELTETILSWLEEIQF